MTFGHWTHQDFRNRQTWTWTWMRIHSETGEATGEQEQEDRSRKTGAGTGEAPGKQEQDNRIRISNHGCASIVNRITGTGEATGLALHTTGPRYTRYSARRVVV
ncbi:MAG: hypothetical protein J3R72DRAFT_495260 [Linnemannia gamsii]|nr:MAG: hypothetical protein J3R72DRAFT_495260 [Linnemannia gamsii]